MEGVENREDAKAGLAAKRKWLSIKLREPGRRGVRARTGMWGWRSTGINGGILGCGWLIGKVYVCCGCWVARAVYQGSLEHAGKLDLTASPHLTFTGGESKHKHRIRQMISRTII